MAKLISNCAPTVSTTLERTWVAKPPAEAVMLYVPGNRFGAVYKPEESDVTVRTIPVETSVIASSAFGNTAPEESVTVPLSVAPATCAIAEIALRVTTIPITIARKKILSRLIKASALNADLGRQL
jgi:hypothetical protein